MSRRAALLIATTLVGCNPHGRVATGTIAAIAGTALLASHADSHCEPRSDFCDDVIAEPLNDSINAFTTTVGLALLVAGLGTAVSGLAALDDEAAPAPTYRPVLTVEAPRPAPIPVALASRVENRLAIQASVTAHAGQCEGARATANRLAEVDPVLFTRLVETDEAVAACMRSVPNP